MPFFIRFVFLLLIGGFVASCSQSSDEASEASQIKFQTGASEFVFNNGAEPETLDPHRMSAHDAAQLSMQLFEGLLSRQADYVKLRPGLAKDWEVSEDGKTYSFTLRDNLKWSNGEPLTMDQVYRSFVRALDPEVAAPYVAWYTDFIEGAEFVFKNYGTISAAERAKRLGIKVDGNQIRFQLVKPVAYFKYLISQPAFFVIHPSMLSPTSPAWTDPKSFVSNSAYKLKDWKVNDRIEFEKNPYYYEADQVTFERLVALPINDKNATWNLYETGQLDWTGDNTIPPHRVGQLKSRADFFHKPILGTYTYIFNVEKEPFDDPRVRKAFALTINRDHIVNRLLRAGYVETHRLVPPVIEGFESQFADLAPYEERVVEAQKLLAEAGFPGGKGLPAITLKYNTDESHHKIAQAVQQMWNEQLGAAVKLENMEWKVFLKEQNRGNFQVSRFAWIGDYPDPTTFLELFQSQNVNNKSRWKNKDYDRLVEEAVSIQDDQERYRRLEKAEKMLEAAMPVAGIYHYAYYSLMNPQVRDYKPNVHGHHLFRYLSKNKVDSSAGLN